MKLGVMLSLALSVTTTQAADIVHFDRNGNAKEIAFDTDQYPSYFRSAYGNKEYGIAVTDGYKIWNMFNFGSPNWVELDQNLERALPQYYGQLLVTGHRVRRPIATDGCNIAHWRKLSGTSYFQWLQHTACISNPFRDITSITGDRDDGVAVLAKEGVTSTAKIYRETVYANGEHKEWKVVTEQGLSNDLEQITGNNRSGLIGFSGRNSYYLRNYSGSWKRLPLHSRRIASITGNNSTGPTILDCAGEIYSLTSYSNPQWVKRGRVDVPSGYCNSLERTRFLTGKFREGSIVIGSGVGVYTGNDDGDDTGGGDDDTNQVPHAPSVQVGPAGCSNGQPTSIIGWSSNVETSSSDLDRKLPYNTLWQSVYDGANQYFVFSGENGIDEKIRVRVRNNIGWSGFTEVTIPARDCNGGGLPPIDQF